MITTSLDIYQSTSHRSPPDRTTRDRRHTSGELVLWPYAYTYRVLPPDMTALDLRAFRAIQSNSMYPTDGDMVDWTYARQRIFSYAFEAHSRRRAVPHSGA